MSPEDLSIERDCEEFGAASVDDWEKTRQVEGRTLTENEKLQKFEIFLSMFKKKAGKKKKGPNQNRVFGKSKVGQKRGKGKGRPKGYRNANGKCKATGTGKGSGSLKEYVFPKGKRKGHAKGFGLSGQGFSSHVSVAVQKVFFIQDVDFILRVLTLQIVSVPKLEKVLVEKVRTGL